MDTPLNVYNLLPPEDENPSITSQMIMNQERAFEAVIDGQWKEAKAALSRIPEDDGPRNFLMPQIESFLKQPPTDWNGVLPLSGK